MHLRFSFLDYFLCINLHISVVFVTVYKAVFSTYPRSVLIRVVIRVPRVVLKMTTEILLPMLVKNMSLTLHFPGMMHLSLFSQIRC